MIIIIITTQTYIGEVKHFPIYEDLLYKLNKHNIFKIVHFVRKDLGLQKSWADVKFSYSSATPSMWYSCYNWWVNINKLLLNKVHNLH